MKYRISTIPLLLISFIVYSNILKNDFALDDTMMIEQNQYTVKGFKGIGDLVSKPSLGGYTSLDKNTYRPLSMAFFGIEYQFFKLSPKAYHVVSILLFGLLCVLIYYFLQNFNFGFWPSFLGSLIFVVHPIHTEVVANIKSQDEILALIFSVLSITEFINYSKSNNISKLLLASFFTIMALLSKENSIVILVLVPIALYFLDLKPSKVKIFGGLLLPTIFYFLARKIALGNFFIMTNDQSWKIPINNALFQTENTLTRFATEIVLLIKYFKMSILPFPLSADYSVGAFPLSTITSVSFFISIALLLGLFFIILKGLKSKSFLSFGLLFFFVPFATTSNILFTIASTFAERFLFFPTVGTSILIAYFNVFFTEKYKIKNVIVGTLILISIIFGFLTFQRNKEWKNSLTLFESAVKIFPNAYRANIGLANSNNKLAIASTGADAQIYKEKAFEYNKKAYNSYNQGNEINHSFGVSYQLMGEFDKAIQYYKVALDSDPVKPEESYENISQCYISKGACDSSYFYLKKAGNSKNSKSYLLLGDCFFEQKNFQKAANSFEKAWTLGNQDNSDNATNLAVCYHLLGNKAIAKSYYEIAIKLNPSNEKAKKNLSAL